jgi:hypothetical protein
MRSKFLAFAVVASLCAGSLGLAEETPNSALAATIKKAVLAKLPKQFEDNSEWGKTIPLPVAVRFPNLRRAVVRVGDHDELPHGTWKRTRVWMADPERDLTIILSDMKKVGKDTSRLRVDATVAVQAQRERKDWIRGVGLPGITADADAVARVSLDVDVTVNFDLARPLDGVKTDVKVSDLRIELKDFHLRRVGPVVIVEQGALGDELKGILQEQLRAAEPKAKDYANQAIAQAIKDGKLPLPSATASR